MTFFKYSFLLILFTGILHTGTSAQDTDRLVTEADTLRGSITPQRAWWEVTFYDLHVTVQPEDSSITGYNNITYRVTDKPMQLQIDLQQPLHIDQIKQHRQPLSFDRVDSSNAYFVDMPAGLCKDAPYTLSVYYHRQATVPDRRASDGGFIWTQDSRGHPCVATANQGFGASVWWLNKDHPSTEPASMSINITVPDPLVDVSNG